MRKACAKTASRSSGSTWCSASAETTTSKLLSENGGRATSPTRLSPPSRCVDHHLGRTVETDHLTAAAGQVGGRPGERPGPRTQIQDAVTAADPGIKRKPPVSGLAADPGRGGCREPVVGGDRPGRGLGKQMHQRANSASGDPSRRDRQPPSRVGRATRRCHASGCRGRPPRCRARPHRGKRRWNSAIPIVPPVPINSGSVPYAARQARFAFSARSPLSSMMQGSARSLFVTVNWAPHSMCESRCAFRQRQAFSAVSPGATRTERRALADGISVLDESAIEVVSSPMTEIAGLVQVRAASRRPIGWRPPAGWIRLAA